ncbi:hypothetical protein Chor_008861 [Crotalus horridus]
MFRRHKPSTLEHKKDLAIQGSALPTPYNGMRSFFNLSQLVLSAGHLRPLPVLRHSKITYVEVEILDAHSKKQICVVDKNQIVPIGPQWYPSRIGLRLERNGPYLKDSVNIKSLAASSIITLYFTDMGQQVSWITDIWTTNLDFCDITCGWELEAEMEAVCPCLACICHCLHYIRLLLETLFVHKISEGHTPLKNMIKVINIHKIFYRN